MSKPVQSLLRAATRDIKFKLPDEYQKTETKAKPEQALHTKESSLIMARVSHERYKNIVKCAVPKHRLNPVLMMFRRENDDIQVIDDSNMSSPGDWVLVRRDDSIPDEDVKHRLERVVYQYGKYIDPLTNRRTLGLYYDDDMTHLERIKVDL